MSDTPNTQMDHPTRLLLACVCPETNGSAVGFGDDNDHTLEGYHGGTTAHSGAAVSAFTDDCILLAHQTLLVMIVPVELYHGVPTVLWDVFELVQVSMMRVDSVIPWGPRRTFRDQGQTCLFFGCYVSTEYDSDVVTC